MLLLKYRITGMTNFSTTVHHDQ